MRIHWKAKKLRARDVNAITAVLEGRMTYQEYAKLNGYKDRRTAMLRLGTVLIQAVKQGHFTRVRRNGGNGKTHDLKPAAAVSR